MANQEHLDILKQGVEKWNQWRKEFPDIRPDLSTADLVQINLEGADLSGVELNGADLGGANLRGAKLNEAYLMVANLRGANLSEADLKGASLALADISRACLNRADLRWADLSMADLHWADLSGANLRRAILVETIMTKAILTNCLIYGISAWDVQLEEAMQLNLIITPPDQPTITVDNLKIAQFIYLMLNNKEIRDVIDTITSKVVLILGRFTPERKAVLNALRDELRKLNYSPVLFDFDKPSNRDITETVSTLAHLARFVIADITEPKSIPQELSHIIPFLPSVPIVPILQVSEHDYGMYEHFISYPWCSQSTIIRNLINYFNPSKRPLLTLPKRR